MDRRNFIETTAKGIALLAISRLGGCSSAVEKEFPEQTGASVFVARGQTAEANTIALVKSLGGIDSLIDSNSIVVIKVNSQWWLQGMTNTDSIMAFIELVLGREGFSGEIIIVDNHQDTEKDSRGWTTAEPNGRFNLNDLVSYFNDRGHANVTKYHWHPAGENPTPLQMRGSGDAVITNPSDGDGYIWSQENVYQSPIGTKAVLAYPIFTSSYSGVTIDLKNGAYQDGAYTGQSVKFINYSAINHHGPSAGVTASIKNYMGVVDMSCGYPAPKPDGFNNTHYIGAGGTFKLLRFLRDNGGHWRIKRVFNDILEESWSLIFKYTGGCLGSYIRQIRKADLNIITAQIVGWGSRIDKTKMAEPKTITASIDPVALDYWTAKNILLPATIAAGADPEYIKLNDPDIIDGPFRKFIEECRRELGGTIDETKIKIIEASSVERS